MACWCWCSDSDRSHAHARVRVRVVSRVVCGGVAPSVSLVYPHTHTHPRLHKLKWMMSMFKI